MAQSGIAKKYKLFGDWEGEKNFWENSKKKICLLHFDHPFTVFQIIIWTRVIVCTYLAAKLILISKFFVKKKKSPKILLPNPLLK